MNDSKSEDPKEKYLSFQHSSMIRGNMSVLAARRSTSKANYLRIETDRNKLDLKSLMQNANFELGSS